MKKYILILAVLAVAIGASASSCDSSEPKSAQEGRKLTEKAFAQQSKSVPYPADELKNPLERHNLAERLLRFNKPDKIGYVYLLSFGKFLGYYTIKGKISSTQSQMTPSDTIDGTDCNACANVVEAPGDDGSYGPNEDGVFFFTTEGAMVQVSTDYIYSDQPIAVGDIPELNPKG